MSKSRKKAVLLASGGLDSTTMAFLLHSRGIEVTPLFINYGQHCAQTEVATLRDVLPSVLRKRVRTVDVSSIYAHSASALIREVDLWTERVQSGDLYLPYRNLLLLTVGASFAQGAGCRSLYSAFINSNHATEIDCSADFFSRLGHLLSDYGTIEVKMPFRYLSKADVVRRAIKLNVPIGRTYSCQAASRIPCGACPNCVERLDAISLVQRTYETQGHDRRRGNERPHRR